MFTLRKSLLLALPLLALVLAQDYPEPSPELETTAKKVDLNEAFQDLVNALPEESLHAALHNHHPKFQDGVYEHDRTAVEKVHSEDPSLATRLIYAARVELMRRQGNNTISSSATTSSPPPVVVPVPITTTDSAGSTIVASSSILSAPTLSVAVEITSTNAAGSTIVATTAAPAVVFTATNAAGSSFLTTSTVGYAHTSGQVLVTTDAKGSTFLTTYTPDGGEVSSILLITTTGQDGQPVTLTSYAYVGASKTGTAQTPGQVTGTNTGKPGLQTGAASAVTGRWGVEALAVVGGAVGVAWLL
jgi:hypothetical protein